MSWESLDRVAIDSVASTPVPSEGILQVERLGNAPDLFALALFSVPAPYFLKRNDVSLSFIENGGDAFGSRSPVQSATTVGVVSGDSESGVVPHFPCSQSNLSGSGWSSRRATNS